MPKRIVILFALLLPFTSVNAALLSYDNRDDWLLAAGPALPDLGENFDAFTTDRVYGLGDIRAGFLNLKAIGANNRYMRIEVPNNASTQFFPVYPNADNSSYPFVTLASFADSRSELQFIDPGQPGLVANALRAIAFEYRVAANLRNPMPGSVETSLGDSVAIDASKSFLGLLYDGGEQFTSLTLRSLGNFGLSIDEIEAFGADASSINPVPLPAAGWLFAGALLGLAGYQRRRACARR